MTRKEGQSFFRECAECGSSRVYLVNPYGYGVFEELFVCLSSPVPAGSRVAFFTGLKKVTKESALWRCARHSCCRFSEMSMVVAEKNQGDLLNVGRRGPMYSAPWGMPGAEGFLKQTVSLHRLWGPHKNRAPLFVPGKAAPVSASFASWSEEDRRKRCPPQVKGPFCFLFVAAWTKRKASGGTRTDGFR